MLLNHLSAVALAGALFIGSAGGRATAAEADQQAVFLFTSFRGDGDGLHLAWSQDARNWADLGNVFLKPAVGSKLMRDPHILRGPDGLFHMVWTSGWSDKGIGYANSSNLVNWSEQRYVPLMEDTPGTKTCWAPEVYYEASLGQYLIIWSSNVETPGVTPPKGGFHRAYYVLTKDFNTFTEPRIFFDPGFNNIDTTMLKVGGKYVIVFKETDDQPAGLWGAIRGATADQPLGPYALLPEPIIKNERVEGPALALVDGRALLYVDYYVNHRYGARETGDWKTWKDVSAETRVVSGQRHGSILPITRAELRRLAPEMDRPAPPPVLPGVNADPHLAGFGGTLNLHPTTDGSEGWRATSFQARSSRDPGSASVATQPAALKPVATVSVDLSQPGRKISLDLFGIFFEDINYSADGGLYAELIQNRSFEYTPGDRKDWNSLTCWEWIERGGGKGTLAVETNQPLHANNPHHAVLTVGAGGGEVGLRNPGFDGIVLKAGELYDFSLFARQMEGIGGPLAVRLEGKEGEVLGEATLPAPGVEWKKHGAAIRAAGSANDARLVLTTSAAGRLALDMISLFPRKTFHNRPNGLRPDLAQVIADMKPRFIRFPGGCVAHGDGLDNIYRWKQTIGPVEQRKAQRNIWRYHQTMGLGYFEYFQLCEDLGAKPLPVVAAGVCCQNAGNYIPGDPKGQQGLPMSEMPDYVQEVLDLIEWANGPVTSKWGAMRAAAGHPDSFKLEYLGVGNEDHITPVFEERFALLQQAIKARHPEITLIGTVGPAAAGPDFDKGWTFARQLRLDMVDEHYYMQPEWFLDNLHRYDSYDRSGPKVYLGEYASRGNTLFNALSEAAYMASLERNGDVVRLSSYAPLLAKTGHTQWNPDLIYFDNTSILLTANYHVQRLYGIHAGDTWLPNTVKLVLPSAPEGTAGVFLGTWDTQNDVRDQGSAERLVASSVLDSESGDIILKVVNVLASEVQTRIELQGLRSTLHPTATCTVLTGDPAAANSFADPLRVSPKVSTISVGPMFPYVAPPHSLSVIRLKSL